MTDKTASGGSGSKLPQTQCLIPRSRQSVSTIRGDNLYSTSKTLAVADSEEYPKTGSSSKPPRLRGMRSELSIDTEDLDGTYAVRDNMRVTVQRSLRIPVLSFVPGQVPDDQGLVPGGRQEHVWTARNRVSHLGLERSHADIFSYHIVCEHTSPWRWPS